MSDIRALLSASYEVLKAFGRGLARAIAYASYAEDGSPYTLRPDDPGLDYFRLCSAIEHLSRTEPVLQNMLGERYIDRVDHASQVMLNKVLEEFGCTLADVAAWRCLYPVEPSTPALL